jgi:hypothetical protein
MSTTSTRSWQRRMSVRSLRVVLPLLLAAVFAVSMPAEPTSAQTASPTPTSNAANRLVVYNACTNLVEMTDAQMATLKSRGVGGFACMGPRLIGLGGNFDWTADPANPLTASKYSLQKKIRDKRFIQRAHSYGFKLYLGFDMGNYYNGRTPLAEWFDDAGWNTKVLPAVRNLSGAARMLGFDGLAVDQEETAVSGGAVWSWDWNYSGNTRSQAVTRAKVKQRGEQMMTEILKGFPNVDMSIYYMRQPDGWNALVQQTVNRNTTAFANTVVTDFWNGMTNVSGYSAIRFHDSVFYKTAHIGSFDTGIAYDMNRLFAYASRNWSNWDYLASRYFISPFIWIDQNLVSEPFSRYRGDGYVADQLATFRKWGMGGEFWQFSYSGILPIDAKWNYSPNVPALRAAAQPGVVDAAAPSLTVTAPPATTTAGNLTLNGHTTDNMAIHYVQWTNSRGGSGNAAMTWQALSGSHSTSYQWRMNFTDTIPLQRGENVITVTSYDIKGVKTTKTVTVTRR